MIRIGWPEINNAAGIEIDGDPTAAIFEHGAPDPEALQDRLFPFTRRASVYLKVRGHVFERPQKLKIERGNAFKHTMASGVVERESGDAFLDHCRSAPVLHLVEQRPALPLAVKQGPGDGRPP